MELVIGETYFLTNGNSYMVLEQETETDYVFQNGMSPWGGPKEDIQSMLDNGELVNIKDLGRL